MTIFYQSIIISTLYIPKTLFLNKETYFTPIFDLSPFYFCVTPKIRMFVFSIQEFDNYINFM